MSLGTDKVNILEEFAKKVETGEFRNDWAREVDWSNAKIYDLSQPLSNLAPPFPTYPPFEFKWIKVLPEHGVQAQYIQGPLHIGTHFDGPLHFDPSGRDIGSIPVEYFIGPGLIIDISDEVGDLDIYTSDMIESKARSYNLEIREYDILVIHTGYVRYAWYQKTADTVRYILKHPGPTKEFADWLLKKKIRWTAIDAVSQDHPLNTVIRRVRPDIVAEFEKKFGKSVDEMMPWPENYQLMHTYLFPRGVLHVENLGGDVDKVLNRRCIIGCPPFKFQGGEAAYCRCFAICSE
ncbi:MAG: cyclase family protein [Desulfurococcales archaeon]|nr:cyclase family protein [Desulfurococcales archaeon]